MKKRKPEQNFQDQSIFSGKIILGGTIFPEKFGPGPKFSVRNKISMTVHQGKPAEIYIATCRDVVKKDPKMINQFQYCEHEQVPYLVIVGRTG